jgi:mannitol-1-phosphate 5-dehydrogenase
MSHVGKVVVFGAGATGRGHVGLLCWQAGYEMVYVDRSRDLVATLSRADGYTVHLYGEGHLSVVVSGCRYLHSGERKQVAEEVVDADLVLTAVFDQNLPDVAVTLAEAMELRRQLGKQEALNCVACENMMDSSSTLGRYVRDHLSADGCDYLDAYVGFPDSMISRVVPRPVDPLEITAEDYNEWTARREAFKGEKLGALTALELVDNQSARLERKLFVHNGGHAVCGYVGFHRGWRYIHEAVDDPVVAEHVLGALEELGEVVRQKHGFSAASVKSYAMDLVRRGSVPEMKDEILRVVRDPIRKLSARERLVAPALEAERLGTSRRWIVKGIAAALHYSHPKDIQSIALQEKLRRLGVVAATADLSGLAPESSLIAEIVEAYESFDLS